jgi:hypothetical protein
VVQRTLPLQVASGNANHHGAQIGNAMGHVLSNVINNPGLASINNNNGSAAGVNGAAANAVLPLPLLEYLLLISPADRDRLHPNAWSCCSVMLIFGVMIKVWAINFIILASYGIQYRALVSVCTNIMAAVRVNQNRWRELHLTHNLVLRTFSALCIISLLGIDALLLAVAMTIMTVFAVAETALQSFGLAVISTFILFHYLHIPGGPAYVVYNTSERLRRCLGLS